MADTDIQNAIAGLKKNNMGLLNLFENTDEFGVTTDTVLSNSSYAFDAEEGEDESTFLMDVRGRNRSGFFIEVVNNDMAYKILSTTIEYLNVEDLVEDDFDVELFSETTISPSFSTRDCELTTVNGEMATAIAVFMRNTGSDSTVIGGLRAFNKL